MTEYPNLVVTTGTLSSDQNTLAGVTDYARVRIVLGANIKINSLPAGFDGQILELINTSATYVVTLTNQSGSGTDKLFTFTDSLDVVLRPLASVVLRFDSTTDTWRQYASAQLERASEIVILASANVALVIANAQTELGGNHRTAFDLTNYSQFMLIEGHSAGTHSATKYGIQYSLDNGSTWTWLDGTAGASAPTAYVDITTQVIVNISSWFSIAAAAKAQVQLRAIFLDGNNVSYNLRNVRLVVR